MEQKKSDELKFQRTRMQKESVLKTLKDKGCRITNQRKVLLDVILDEECTSCKEIYYKASKKDQNIGPATVYRMINTLEEIGAITRRSTFTVNLPPEEEKTAV